MTVNTIGTTVSLAEAQVKAVTATKADDMGADTFLQLMLTQMRNQNPLEPMKDTEMISQMAQLNSVEQLQKMSSSMSSVDHLSQVLSASGMMGKSVTYDDGTENEVVGLVKSVSIDGNNVYLTIGDVTVSLSSVVNIA